MTLPMRKEAACLGCSNENLNIIYTGRHKKKKTSSAPKSIAPFPPPSYIARVCLDISCLDKYSAIINSHHTSSILGVLGHRRKGKAAYATSRKFTTPALANTLKETPP